ncbi:hypothetical protein MMC16_005563 [Acarospora aff. strigata]|nr:hypothetical protein [Acarospora aff. strigata]
MPAPAMLAHQTIIATAVILCTQESFLSRCKSIFFSSAHYAIAVSPSLSNAVMALLRPTIASRKLTRWQSLHEYLRIKIHPRIRRQDWDTITIVGDHLRDPTAELHAEKHDNNWQRRTATAHLKDLTLHCLPERIMLNTMRLWSPPTSLLRESV